MGWILCIHCEKFQCDFVARTFVLIAPVQPVLHQASCSNETIQNAPNTMKCSNTWVWGPMEWVGCICCKKFQNDFMAQTCALIAPVQPVLQRVLSSNETLPNAPKHYETHTNMSLGSNGVDWVCLLWKSLMRLHGTNFCINCTCSTHLHRVLCSNETLPNAP